MDLVFYFSGSGNSLSVAKALSDNPINIATLKEPYGEYVADSIGFVFPVYCMEAPLIVNKFIKEAKFVSPYIWAICTYGGGAGNSLSKIDKILQESGNRLSYGNGLILPDSCIVFATAKDKQQEYLDKETSIVAKIKQDIDKRLTNTHKMTVSNIILNKVSWVGMRALASRKSSTKSCTKCDLCVDLCPTKNIKRISDKLHFGKNCEYCFGCIQFCPHNAIKFGLIKRDNRTVYTHPSIKIQEMISRNNRG